MLPAIIFLTLAVQVMWPFAVLSDVMVAGIFSIVNTLLNGVTILLLGRAKIAADAAANLAEEAAQLSAVVARRTDSPRHPRNGDRERKDDPPPDDK